MTFFNDFKEFLAQGRMFEMAIGVGVGASFSGVVTSVMDDFFMPIITFFMRHIDFSSFFLVLQEGEPGGPYTNLSAAKEAGALTLNLGSLLTSLITFVLVTVFLFLVFKFVVKLYTSRLNVE